MWEQILAATKERSSFKNATVWELKRYLTIQRIQEVELEALYQPPICNTLQEFFC